jgi:hypothetical protein
MQMPSHFTTVVLRVPLIDLKRVEGPLTPCPMIEMLPATITCAGCSMSRAVKPTPKEEARTPTGWKKQGDAPYCPQCWR